MIDGVCAGFAEHFGVDPSVVRLALIALTILNFAAGMIFYIVSMVIMPIKSSALSGPSEYQKETSRKKNSEAAAIVGIVIVVIGVILLFHYERIFSTIFVPRLGILSLHSVGNLLLPIILILTGSIFLMARRNESHQETLENEGSQVTSHGQSAFDNTNRLFRSSYDKKVAGVCGGIAEYLKIDSTLVRLAFVLAAVASFGMALILYFVCALVIPMEKI